MLTDAIRLLLFPALMAFAASSDLLTMTISNRVSLVLAGGFFLLALVTGMSLAAIGMHLAAAALVLAVAFGFFAHGWIGGGDAKLAAATALWLGFDHLLDYLLYASLFGGVLTLRADPVPHAAAAGPAGRPGMGQRLHRDGRRRALRHRARRRGARGLSRRPAGCPRSASEVAQRRASRRARTILTRFRYRSLTMP